MQTLISTLCTCVLLVLSWSAAAQPTQGTSQKLTEGSGRAVCGIPLPPPPPEPDVTCCFQLSEELPRFPGCEGLPTLSEKKQCSDERMLEFIYGNISYPASAWESGIEGTVVIQFSIEKDGSVADEKIVRDIGGQCGREALRVINLMNQQVLKWIPGKQNGRSVRVQMNIPVRFYLDGSIPIRQSTPPAAASEKENPNVEEPVEPACQLPPLPPQCLPSPYHLIPKEEEVFKIVEEMPRFPGCEELPTAEEKKQCADRKMLKFLYENITYPALARENCIGGAVVIQFVIEKDGSITNGRVVRDIGAHCGEEVLRVVNRMNEQGLRWIPGKQRGRAVRVQFHLPIKFRIECPQTHQPDVQEEPVPAPNGQEEKVDETLPPTKATPFGTPLKLEPEGFRLFPNPATDWLNVHLLPALGPVSLSIINPTGQVLWKQEYGGQDGPLKEQVSLASWPSGTYFLHIEQPGSKYTQLFVKQ